MFDIKKLRNTNCLARLGYYHIYLQIPFCASRCPFCCFVSGLDTGEMTNLSLINDYLDALIFDIECYEFPDKPLQSIVLGGGTPAILNGQQVKKLMDTVMLSARPKLAPSFLTSFETTPELATIDKLKEFYDAGMQRVSIGAQSYFADELKLLGRRNTPEQAMAAFSNARKAGFQSINIDLLGGFPGSTFERWRQNLSIVFNQSPEFITTNIMGYAYTGADHYVKSLEKRGYFLPPFEERVAMYEYAFEELEKHGYEPVDFVVFCKPGYQFAYEVHGLGMADNVVGIGPWVLSAMPEYVRINYPFIKHYIKQPLFKWASSAYKDNIYQIIHGHLICNGRVSSSELDPLLGCSLREAIEASDKARVLVKELELHNYIEWTSDGFQFYDNKIAAGVVCLWDYQRKAKMMV